jgi:protease-4
MMPNPPTLRTRIRRARNRFANWRRAKHEVAPYIAFNIRGEIAEFPEPLPVPKIPFINRLPFFSSMSGPTSLSELRRTFEQLALDPRIKGVRLKITCHADASIYQSLRKILLDFRATGKRIVAYGESFGPFQYYLACACDQIVMPPPAEWGVLGFQNEYVFFKDALDQLGIGVDLVRVSPFKSAGDQFVQTDFSEDSRQQAEWLLDARFEELVRGISEGRKLEPARVRDLINRAPFSAPQAVQHGLIDATLYEDELERFISPESAQAKPEEPPRWMKALPAKWQAKLKEQMGDEPAPTLVPYNDVRKSLLVPYIEYERKRVGVVRIEGTIASGNSIDSPLPLPLVGGQIAGSNTVAQAIRQAEADKNIAAVILYVDSPGGSSLASDVMAREVRRLMLKKPVVVYMGGVAASGGYYVSALANAIVAQPMTVTGSIGVFALKPNTREAFDKLFLHRTLLKRGQNAGMFSDATPLSESERAAIENSVSRTYHEFKTIVAEGRKLDYDALEPLCGGRVWTGAMAHEHNLVDVLGDFTVALEKAREMAKLPAGKRVQAILVSPPKEAVLPKPFEKAGAIKEMVSGLEEMRALLLHTRIWAMSVLSTAKTT